MLLQLSGYDTGQTLMNTVQICNYNLITISSCLLGFFDGKSCSFFCSANFISLMSVYFRSGRSFFVPRNEKNDTAKFI